MKRGDIVGFIHHLERPDRAPETILAQSDGYLIMMRAPCLTRQGDCVAVIAKPVTEDEVLGMIIGGKPLPGRPSSPPQSP